MARTSMIDGQKTQNMYTILLEYVLGRTYVLVSRVLVLVGQSLPLVALFDHVFTRTIAFRI
jgi:hypothetical protein